MPAQVRFSASSADGVWVCAYPEHVHGALQVFGMRDSRGRGVRDGAGTRGHDSPHAAPPPQTQKHNRSPTDTE